MSIQISIVGKRSGKKQENCFHCWWKFRRLKIGCVPELLSSWLLSSSLWHFVFFSAHRKVLAIHMSVLPVWVLCAYFESALTFCAAWCFLSTFLHVYTSPLWIPLTADTVELCLSFTVIYLALGWFSFSNLAAPALFSWICCKLPSSFMTYVIFMILGGAFNFRLS